MKCNKCNIDKPIDAFYIRTNRKSNSLCKECEKERSKNYRELNRVKINIKKKQYRQASAKFKSWNEKLILFEETRKNPENQNLIQVKCAYCGGWFTPTNEEVMARIKYFNGKGLHTNGKSRTHGEARFYCSEPCKRTCPIYGKVKYPEGHRPASPVEVNSEFRKLVFNEDNFTCLFCGKSKLEILNLELHCHHVNPRAISPLEECDLNNAITLCKECHTWIHTHVDGCKYNEICRK